MNIDYTFKVDGLYHSINYYRSETPMDINSMPIATAAGITGLSYSDETAEAEKAYYVRFGSVRSDVEKISDEIRVSTFIDPLDSYVVSLLRFTNGFTDEKGNTWQARGAGTYVENSELIVSGGTSNGLLCTNNSFLDMGYGDFCFECIGEITTEQQSDVFLSTNQAQWQSGSAALALELRRMRYVYYGPPVIEATLQASLDTMHHFAFSRQNGVQRMFLDGVMLREDSYNYAVNFSSSGSILFGNAWGGLSPTGRFNCVRITKGQARYIENFDPPIAF